MTFFIFHSLYKKVISAGPVLSVVDLQQHARVGRKAF